MSNLAGQCLVAMPGIGDPRFEHAVVYLCAHSDDGAMGLIVNKPTPELRFKDLLESLGIDGKDTARDIRVHFGGPVETTRGFVLHSADYSSDGVTLDVEDGVGLTATPDVLEALAKGEGPKSSMLALGYSGWGPGQLEEEIAQNGWLLCPGRTDLLFGRANEHKWAAALKSIGIDPVSLSGAAGRA